MTKKILADTLAGLATRALLTEAAITPKPGLVDAANSGAHRDMDLVTFLDSAATLTPYFRDVVLCTLEYHGPLGELIHTLRPIGLRAERDMFAVTGGVNTHKGAIFSLGILCAAAAWLNKTGAAITPSALMQTSAAIAKGRSRTDKEDATSGAQAYAEHGLPGILGEAAQGFPHVFRVALPVLQDRMRTGDSLQTAGVAALLHLIAVVDDTNVVARCGIDVLREVQAEVGAKLAGVRDGADYVRCARVLDAGFIRRNVSPGGCADLLAGAVFVGMILAGKERVLC
ncbi:MAG: triphosphoribosyl-dephospho-CoA synthase [Oscillospiraceae bacterium]|nr:triphosphoribosyl-dephospho-CoA synthase [Oscillospiraceae bacterium]